MKIWIFWFHHINERFYSFYSKWDLIKGTILLVVLHVLMTPFIIWAVQFIILGHSFFLAFILSGISLINVGYYIKAVVRFIVYCRQMKILRENDQLPDPNVDIVWQVKRPW